MVSRSLLSVGIVVLALFSMPCHASIEAFKQHVQAEVAAINVQAERRQMKDAVERLNSLNRYIEQSLNFDLEEELAQARQSTPSFRLDLDLKLRPELTANWWQGKYDQGQRALKLSQEAVSGLSSMRVLDKQDKAWSYLKTTYGAIKTVKDVVQSVAQQEYFDAFKNAKEGVDGFLEDYDQIDEAELKSLQTDLFAAEVRRLESRAKKALRELEPVLSFMKSAADEGDRFERQMQRLHKLARDVEAGKVPALVFGDPRYTWNYETFKISVEENNRSFETGTLDCAAFKQHFEAIRQAARQDWNRITGQIKASQDEEQKPRFLQWHNEAWEDFVSVVPPQFTRLYQQRCQGNAISKSQAKQEVTPPLVTSAGAVADLGSEVEMPVAAGKTSAGAPAAQSVGTSPAKAAQGAGTAQARAARGGGSASGTAIKTADASLLQNKAPAPQSGSIDHFWEKTIPETARFDWVVDNSAFELRYQLSGRTLGYRVYNDSGLKTIKNEYLMDNLGVMHGATRGFAYDAKTQRIYTAEVTFYRNNLRAGPAARFNVAGDVESQSFWVEGVKISEQEYRLKVSKDKSLPPVDAALNKIWRTVPANPGMPVAALPIDANQIPWQKFDIPAQAMHYVEATLQSGGEVYLSERYVLPGFSSAIGERVWVREGNAAPRLYTEEIYREGRLISLSGVGVNNLRRGPERIRIPI